MASKVVSKVTPIPQSVLALRSAIHEMAPMDDGDAARQVMWTIQERIGSAESVMDIFEAANQGPGSVEDYVDVPLRITGFRFAKSAEQFTQEGSLNAFAFVTAINLLTGEEVVITCGGEILLAQLYQFQKHGHLPLECTVVQNTTSAGHSVYKLGPLSGVMQAAVRNMADERANATA